MAATNVFASSKTQLQIGSTCSWHTPTPTHTDKLQLWRRHQALAWCAGKAQVLVFAISSPEILGIRTDGTCSNRGRLSGAHAPLDRRCRLPTSGSNGPDFPLSGFVRTSKTFGRYHGKTTVSKIWILCNRLTIKKSHSSHQRAR